MFKSENVSVNNVQRAINDLEDSIKEKIQKIEKDVEDRTAITKLRVLNRFVGYAPSVQEQRYELKEVVELILEHLDLELETIPEQPAVKRLKPKENPRWTDDPGP